MKRTLYNAVLVVGMVNLLATCLSTGGGDGPYLLIFACNAPLTFLGLIHPLLIVLCSLFSPFIYGAAVLCLQKYRHGEYFYYGLVTSQMCAFIYGLTLGWKWLGSREVVESMNLIVRYLLPYVVMHVILVIACVRKKLKAE